VEVSTSVRASVLARWPALLAVALFAGCAGHRQAIDRALAAGKDLPPTRDLAAHYLIRCPDQLEIRAPQCPEAEGVRAVAPSGFIVLLPGGEVEIAGLTAPEAGHAISRRLGCLATCRVVKHDSQHVFLVDPRGATQRAVPYRGPETVVEFLRRAGGLEGAELQTVQVVRAHVADGRPPEVFDVDLGAILLKQDAQTDVRLAPFDRVYVAQTKRWRLCACLPPWMRPVYRRLTGEAEAARALAGPSGP
jgi:protein involved in polysaccharide export with SLBB domain